MAVAAVGRQADVQSARDETPRFAKSRMEAGVRRFCWAFAQTLVRPRRAIAAIAAAPSARGALAATGLFGGLYSLAAFTS